MDTRLDFVVYAPDLAPSTVYVPSNAWADSFDDTEDFCLPRLKDDKAIGIADVDAPEESGRKQSIYLNFWSIPFLVACGCHEGYLMTDVVADPQVLRRQNGKRSFCSIYTAATSGRPHE